MGLFSKNKKTLGGLRTLSEDEIQRKLYGAYKPERKSAPKPAKSGPETSHPPVAVREKTPPSQSPAVQDDLFVTPPQSARPEPIIPQIPVPEPVSEQERMSRLSEIADKEQKRQQPILGKDPWQKKPKAIEPRAQISGVPVKKILDKMIVVLGVCLKFIFGALIFFFSFVAKLIGSIDLRRPEARRGIYWIAGISVLIALFAGVHILNVRREAAMKTPVTGGPADADREGEAGVRDVPPADESPARPASRREDREEVLQPPTPAAERPVKKEAPKQEPEKKPAPPPASEGRYVIQIATYANSEDANGVLDDLKSAGFPVFVKALTRPTGKIFYSVFMGRYKTFQEAQLQLEKFRKKNVATPFEDAFIRSLDS